MFIVGVVCENVILFLVYNKCKEGIYFLWFDGKGKDREFNMKEIVLVVVGVGFIVSFIL